MHLHCGGNHLVMCLKGSESHLCRLCAVQVLGAAQMLGPADAARLDLLVGGVSEAAHSAQDKEDLLRDVEVGVTVLPIWSFDCTA